jgi:hypothetical protein
MNTSKIFAVWLALASAIQVNMASFTGVFGQMIPPHGARLYKVKSE